MALNVESVEVVTVDSYGTVVDPYATQKKLGEYVDEVESIARQWRYRSLLYTMTGNFFGEYRTFYEMNGAALEFALLSHGNDLPEQARDDILSVYHELDVFPDVREGLREITDRGYPVYVLSNGNPDMLDSMVNHAGITDLIEDTISAHEIRTFKPHRAIYEHAAERTDTPLENIAHLSGLKFDVQGAVHAGMQGVWVRRKDEPWECFGPRADHRVDSFTDFAGDLPERPAP